jgi:pSer/pThr/pTyr-binding forkhead associated (FHA) protein
MAKDYHFVVRTMGQKKRLLRRGDQLTIGRDASNDLVLKDGTVSRHHVSVTWDSDQAFPLIEVISSSGVELDGGAIHEDDLFLTDDMTLGLGDATVVFQLKGKRPTAPPSGRMHKIEDPTVVRLFSESTARLKGQFSNPVTLQKVLLGLESKARTGTLEIQSDGERGKLIFGQGRVITAAWQGLPPAEALDALAALGEGEFIFTADLEPSEVNLNRSMHELLGVEPPEPEGDPAQG